MIKPFYVEATDIQDAWFQLVHGIFEYGRRFEVQQGSFVGQTRLQYDYISVLIKHPYNDNYDMMLPEIPPGLNIDPPVQRGYVEQYIPYLMTAAKCENEEYTYGERLCAGDFKKINENFIIKVNQIESVINLLKETKNTNQAILQVGQPGDCMLADPPCLRHIEIKVIEDKLIFFPVFRSWDLWNGFPANLAGIAILQKYMADEIGIESGSMIASSSGLHIYGYAENIAKIRANI